ncbi:DUF2721 domain-containing protein [Rariglobus hedericola]|uniref:DUF2721 domain-containing protein n=1 Tax=Rariglobus hedericola TaxID=2597822 RepID=A0A556QSL3_9BACT|nr:DUF2721 domain-containing protein [Rariglobus hedericola]TSJ79638.1 DUF2721 domain-containing protein [Rariglobus hedericola]
MAIESNSLLPMIQLAITPVILITGLGSLMLTMTNRLGRIVDRTRILAGQTHAAKDDTRGLLEAQLRILYRRAKFVRLAVMFNTLGMFTSGMLVVVIFVSALAGVEAAPLILALFMGAIGFLLTALGYFLSDINLTLRALGMEVDRALAEPAVK